MKSPYWFPKWLHPFALPPAMEEHSSPCSTSWPAWAVICVLLAILASVRLNHVLSGFYQLKVATCGNFQNWQCLLQYYVLYSEILCVIFIIRKFDLQKVTFQKAREHSVRTARLPIQEYMIRRQNEKNYHSEILAINQGTAHSPTQRALPYGLY